ncbi:hypothetical protein ABBQ32_013632 [Trebouxia sp. C0010 RCD-2024]
MVRPYEALRAVHTDVQGINRLGKAAPKPGSLRPPDPNRRQDLDLFSEGAETDADYMRMVHDIEDTQQNQSGWLFGRGGMLQLFVSSDTDFATTVLHDNATVTMQPMACNFGSAGIRFYWHQPQPRLNIYAAFDKGDLLYLRDEEEKRRFTEMELRDSEQQQFRKERARIEAERAAAALRAAQARKDKQGRIKPSNAQNSSSQEQGEPPTKRLKADQDSMGASAPSQLTAPAAAPPGNPLPAASPTPKSQSVPGVEAPQASLSAMLGNYASESEESDNDQAAKDDADKG